MSKILDIILSNIDSSNRLFMLRSNMIPNEGKYITERITLDELVMVYQKLVSKVTVLSVLTKATVNVINKYIDVLLPCKHDNTVEYDYTHFNVNDISIVVKTVNRVDENYKHVCIDDINQYEYYISKRIA